MKRRLRQLAADLRYVVDTYSWVPLVLIIVLLAVVQIIDNPVTNPQNFGLK